MSTRLKVMRMIAFLVLLIYPVSLYGYDFHINDLSDSLKKKEVERYVGSPISAVTAALGAPSLVRDNASDPANIDYIYVGTKKVDTFVIQREGKQIVAAYQDNRGNWEGGVFPQYKDKKKS